MAAPSTASLTEQIQQALNDKVLMEAWRSSGAALFFSQQNFEQGHDTACAASLRNHLLAALAPVLAAYEQKRRALGDEAIHLIEALHDTQAIVAERDQLKADLARLTASTPSQEE